MTDESNGREPILGPNAWPVFWQFTLGLAFTWFVAWLIYQPVYDLTGELIAWFRR